MFELSKQFRFEASTRSSAKSMQNPTAAFTDIQIVPATSTLAHEHGEHRTFPAVSTVAHSSPAGDSLRRIIKPSAR
jgi:hypothetical protein